MFFLFMLLLHGFITLPVSAHPHHVNDNNQTISRRQHLEVDGCRPWPERTVPYCWNGVTEQFRKVFKAGVAKWTSKGIGVTFEERGLCNHPSRIDNRNLNDVLEVTQEDGFWGGQVRYQPNSHHYFIIDSAPDFGFPHGGDPKLHAALIAQYIGILLCLEYEHRMPVAQDSLQWDYDNLVAYEEAQRLGIEETEIDQALNSLEHALSLFEDHKFFGPIFYNKQLIGDYSYRKTEFDPYSIMLGDGRLFAKPGTRMFKFKPGVIADTEMPSRQRHEPSEMDVEIVKSIWGTHVNEKVLQWLEDVSPPILTPPDSPGSPMPSEEIWDETTLNDDNCDNDGYDEIRQILQRAKESYQRIAEQLRRDMQ